VIYLCPVISTTRVKIVLVSLAVVIWYMSNQSLNSVTTSTSLWQAWCMHVNENTRNILGVCLNVNPLTKLGQQQLESLSTFQIPSNTTFFDTLVKLAKILFYLKLERTQQLQKRLESEPYHPRLELHRKSQLNLVYILMGFASLNSPHSYLPILRPVCNANNTSNRICSRNTRSPAIIWWVVPRSGPLYHCHFDIEMNFIQKLSVRGSESTIRNTVMVSYETRNLEEIYWQNSAIELWERGFVRKFIIIARKSVSMLWEIVWHRSRNDCLGRFDLPTPARLIASLAAY